MISIKFKEIESKLLSQLNFFHLKLQSKLIISENKFIRYVVYIYIYII